MSTPQLNKLSVALYNTYANLGGSVGCMGVLNPVVCLSYGKPREIPHYIDAACCVSPVATQPAWNDVASWGFGVDIVYTL